jgi:aquaporin Z
MEVWMSSLVMEGIGTFFLVLVVGLTVIAPGAGAMAPLAIGVILMAMIYAGGHVSGAHYNPAVTLAVWMRGKLPAGQVLPYIIAQLTGAAGAASVTGLLTRGSPVVAMQLNASRAFLAELVFTFALASVVLHVATVKKTADNSYFGLAIGGTVLAGAYAVGAISGGVFNPAVAIGITLLGLAQPSQIPLFFAAQFAGGALAALAFRATHPEG